MTDRRSTLPRVDALLDHDAVSSLGWSRALKKEAIAEVLNEVRTRLALGESPVSLQGLAERVAGRLEVWTSARPREVINATGVLLHTNLGRAPLPETAVTAIRRAAAACDLEFDLESGRRASRFSALGPLLRVTTGAADSHVVNNGAAALLLACTALGGGGVALSRGQMVEIGDSFRVAEMASAGGVSLREVGATNKTHLRDYEAAIAEGASMLLWVHRSNFVQSGFVAEPSLQQLAGLAQAKGVALVADLGSGCLGGAEVDGEPTIAQIVGRGANLVTCSADKLLGGPQSGLLCGDSNLVQRCRRHPMARALRPGKTTLAALHATLAAHAVEGPKPLPLYDMLRASGESLETRAEAIRAELQQRGIACQVRASTATVGGGALPGSEVESVALWVAGGDERSARLRGADVPVVGRVREGWVVLDLRSVPPSRDSELVEAVAASFLAPFSGPGGSKPP